MRVVCAVPLRLGVCGVGGALVLGPGRSIMYLRIVDLGANEERAKCWSYMIILLLTSENTDNSHGTTVSAE